MPMTCDHQKTIKNLASELEAARRAIEDLKAIRREDGRLFDRQRMVMKMEHQAELKKRDENDTKVRAALDAATEVFNNWKSELDATLERCKDAKKWAMAEAERSDGLLKIVKTMQDRLREHGCACEPPRTGTPSEPICQICRFEFSEHPESTPRILDCGHSVCHGCAQQLITESTIKCPFDRTETTVASGRASVLPKNFTVLEMIRGRGGGVE